MAEATAAKVPEAPTPAAAPAPAPAKASPPRDRLSLLIFVVNIANLAVLGATGFFMQKMWVKMREVNAQAEKILATKAQREKAAEEPIGKDYQPKPMGDLYPMDSFLVNIASDQGPKFLQTQMEFEVEDPSVEEELAKRRAAIRDAIIVMLSSRTFAQLRDANGMRNLRQDLIHTVNNLLSTGKIKDIYFTQFHFN
jgi:flagellar FliL protein